MTEEEKYRDCTRFKFVCPMEKCGKENIVEGVFTSLAPDQASQKVSAVCVWLGGWVGGAVVPDQTYEKVGGGRVQRKEEEKRLF